MMRTDGRRKACKWMAVIALYPVASAEVCRKHRACTGASCDRNTVGSGGGGLDDRDDSISSSVIVHFGRRR